MPDTSSARCYALVASTVCASYGRWRIARGDLARLRQPDVETRVDVASAMYPETALRTMMAERDQLIRQLRQENAALAAQCQGLQARLAAVVAKQVTPLPEPQESACVPPEPPQHQQAGAKAVSERTTHEAPDDTPVPLSAAAALSGSFPRRHLIARLTTILRRFSRA
jgi:hypothetical protein